MRQGITEVFKMNKTKDAREFSKKAHAGQKRKNSKNPYFVHPMEVFKILSFVTEDKNILCAGLLHDVLEDTEVTEKELSKEFGKKIISIVKEVTKDKKGMFHIKTREGLMVKLADMLSNIKDSKDKNYIKKKIAFVSGKTGNRVDLGRVSDDTLNVELRRREKDRRPLIELLGGIYNGN